MIQNDQRQETCEVSLDQSKRMVTIRRVNVPHAEPQVTVTAKGISPDKDKLLYTFINGQLIPSTNLAAAVPSVVIAANANDKTDKSMKSKQNVKVDAAASNAKPAKKPTETILPDKNAKKNPKEKPSTDKNAKTNEKTNGRKASPENVKQPAAKPLKTATPNPTVKEKEKDKQKQKKGKKDAEAEIETITNSTKELTINEEKPKKEKKKVKAVKFEYADPNYKVNQFDLLDMDEDDDYYTESSSDESSEDEPAPVAKPNATVTKLPTPPLSNQSSIDSQPAQNSKNNKSQTAPQTATATKTVKAADNSKKAKNDANAKAQPQKTEKKSSSESNSAASAKSVKPSNAQPQQQANAAVMKPTNTVDDSSLSKKQKKKSGQKQNTTQTQQPQPNAAARTATRAVSVACGLDIFYTKKYILSIFMLYKHYFLQDSDFNSMSSSMQRMRLDSDTTNEASKTQSPNKVSSSLNLIHILNGCVSYSFAFFFQSSPNISIMDQLNRGVKVEGLMLPPGITLTRVDPNSAEGMRAKKEAISRVSVKFFF